MTLDTACSLGIEAKIAGILLLPPHKENESHSAFCLDQPQKAAPCC